MSENKYFKVKIEGELVVYCSEEEISSRVFRDLYEDVTFKIIERKEISEEEAYIYEYE